MTAIPTLAFMAGVYRRSTEGGADSERFQAYVAAAAESVPVSGYNPMTSKPVLETIEALVAVKAEARLASVANEVAARLGFRGEATMHFTVATPGMWTDRLATEVEHRLLGRDPGGVLWWFDEAVDAEAVESDIAAQTVRLVASARGGPPWDLAAAVHQEGLAMAMAGHDGRLDPGAADVAEVLGEDPSLSTMVSFLYGDDAAVAMGFTPLGLGDRVGYRHADRVGDDPHRHTLSGRPRRRVATRDLRACGSRPGRSTGRPSRRRDGRPTVSLRCRARCCALGRC